MGNVRIGMTLGRCKNDPCSQRHVLFTAMTPGDLRQFFLLLLTQDHLAGPFGHPFFSFAFPPYMLTFLQTLLTKGSAGETLLDKPCRGKTSSSTRLDREE